MNGNFNLSSSRKHRFKLGTRWCIISTFSGVINFFCVYWKLRGRIQNIQSAVNFEI